MRIKTLVAGAALMLTSITSANASIIETIDDFSTDQGPLTATLSALASGAVIGSGILGGERDLMLEIFADQFSQGASVNVAGGNFFFSSGSGVEAEFTLQWDGEDNGSMDVNTFGLGGIDFGGASTTFITSIVEADLNAFFNVTFWSGQGDSAVVETRALPIPGVQSPGRDAFFSAGIFTETDFSNIGAIQVRGNIVSPETQLRQRSYDLQLGSVVAVSEPGTLGALAAGALGLLLTRRRV